jgi:hypothetical protein
MQKKIVGGGTVFRGGGASVGEREKQKESYSFTSDKVQSNFSIGMVKNERLHHCTKW